MILIADIYIYIYIYILMMVHDERDIA